MMVGGHEFTLSTVYLQLVNNALTLTIVKEIKIFIHKIFTRKIKTLFSVIIIISAVINSFKFSFLF